MLRRTLTALALGAVALPAIIYGGWFYFLLIAVFLVGFLKKRVRVFKFLLSIKDLAISTLAQKNSKNWPMTIRLLA